MLPQPAFSAEDRRASRIALRAIICCANADTLKLKFRRIELGLSQSELAKMAGVTRQTIGLIESGAFNPSVKLCIAICKALGVTLNDLFWEEDEDETKSKLNAEPAEDPGP